MGLIRKSLMVGTGGIVSGSSKKQKVAKASLRTQQGMLSEMKRTNQLMTGTATSPFKATRGRRNVGPLLSSIPVNAAATQQYSEDGNWWWNGQQWVAVQKGPVVEAPAVAAPAVAAPILSPDGHFWWDGSGWQPMPKRG